MERRTTSLSVLVPVYNEQYLVESSLRRLEELGDSPLLRRIQVVVVNNGSCDGTAAAIERFRNQLSPEWGRGKFDWEFIRLHRNVGRGGAVQKALRMATGELAVTHDADLEYYPADLLRMIPLFLDEDADAVFGSRFKGGEFRRLLLLRHALGNRLVTFLGGLACNLDLTDIASCYKMVRTELFQSIPFAHRDFRMEAELAIKLAKRNARIFEIPIRYSGRTLQQGKKLKLRDVYLVIQGILSAAFSHDLYRRDSYGSDVLSRLNYAPRFSRWLAEKIAPHTGARVLEIGAGVGSLTVHLTPRERYWATDPNPLYLHNLRRLATNQPYLHAALVDLSRPETLPRGEPFDTIICRYSLEHAADDTPALRYAYEALAEGGKLIVVVPQGPALRGQLDQRLGLRRRYTEDGLRAACRAAGFDTCEILPFNRASTAFWWLDTRILRRNNVGFLSLKLFNAAVPLLRRIDGALPVPPLSLIGVFRKPIGVRPDSASYNSWLLAAGATVSSK